MNCPKCNGKMGVKEVRHDVKEQESYRYCACKNCGHEIFTVEFEVIQNDKFKALWNRISRSSLRRRL